MSTFNFPTDHTYIRYEEDVDFPEAWLANFRWQDRAAYLAWVGEWKAALRDRIQAIRDEKATRRDKTADISVRGMANAERQALRIDCFNLFVIRRIGKRIAGEQRAANRNIIA